MEDSSPSTKGNPEPQWDIEEQVSNMTDEPVATEAKTVESKITDDTNMTNQPVTTEAESGESELAEPAFDYNALLREKEERQKKLQAMNPETEMETTLQNMEATLFTDSAGRNMPTFHAYLSINDEALSSPSKEQAELLKRPLRNSIEHKVSGTAPNFDYSFITITHLATGFGLYNTAVGETRVTIKDIISFDGLVNLDTSDKVLAELKKYQPEVEKVPSAASLIKFTARVADIDVSWLALRELKMNKDGKRIACPQLEKTRSLVSNGDRKDPLSFELLIICSDDATNAKVAQFCQLVSLLKDYNTLSDPLAPFFEKVGSDRYNLPLGQAPTVADDTYPDIGTVAKTTRYVNKRQQLVHQVVGSANEYRLQEFASNNLQATEFQVHLLPCPHVEGEERAIMVVRTEGKGSLLPQNGESCKVSFDNAVLEQDGEPEGNNEISEQHAEIVIANLLRIFRDFEDSAADIATNSAPWLREALTEAEVEPILRTENEDAVQYKERFDAFWEAQKSKLDATALAKEEPKEESENNTLWCSATRLDIPLLHMRQGWQTYLVQSPIAKDGSVETKFATLAQHDNEPWEEYFSRAISDDNSCQAFFKRILSDKAVKAEVHAINSLIHPASAYPSRIHPRSLATYNYLVRFESGEEDNVNLLHEIPELGNVEYSSMDDAKLEAFKNLSKTPAGIKFIPGVAACGKSTLLQTIIMSLFYGGCDQATSAAECEPGKKRVIYSANNNAAVDTFAKNLEKHMNKLGLKKTPDIVRLYSMDSEVASLTKPKQRQPDPFDREGAQDTAKQFSETDLFLAQYVITRAEMKIHEAKQAQSKKKSDCRNMSLQEAAVKRDPAQRRHAESLKAYVKLLFGDYLAHFSGVVCCTPVAASNYLFRSHFTDVDLVLVDEAGRMRELELLILVAWFGSRLIVVGDMHQLGPFVQTDPKIDNEVQSHNAFVTQLAYATIGRAVDAGVTDSYLCVNHRQHGRLSALPSALIYRNQMISSKAKRPEGLKSFHTFLKGIKFDMPANGYRLIVEFPGSACYTVGTSSANYAHVKWVIAQVVRALKDETLTSTKKDGPATILVMPYYRAQLQAYQQAFDQQVTGGQVTAEEAQRVKFATLDSSQGDEADLCIIDYTKTQSPGFCGDLRRQCLTLTRSRQCEIIILNRGMFASWEADPKVKPRAKVLRRLYDDVDQKGAVIRIPTCLDCQTPNAGHDSCENGKFEGKCGHCKDDHEMRNCPRAFCFNCRHFGHRSNECEEPMKCSRCGGKDHIVDDCDKNQRCLRCRTPGHYERDCTLCEHCLSDLHSSDDCEAKPCGFCKEIGHDIDNCPTRPRKTCRRCQQPGHIAKDCRQSNEKTCSNCGEVGHISRFCPTKRITCFRCNEEGHTKSECPKTAEECATCRECLEMGHFARNCPNRKLCDKCGSTKHDADHCVTGVHCSLCSSEEHISADCRTPKILCVNCNRFGHVEADCKVNPEQRAPRADGNGPRTGTNSLPVSEKKQENYQSVTNEYTIKIRQLLSTDDNAGSLGNEPVADTAPWGAEPGARADTASWGAEPPAEADEAW
ncbi:hypothetical protein QBC33DRAFT_573845 [Phialemonium atrogriseum]|uniref:CCHC-type domain-containing protein n=1 Tax=Phialemonium atrogriseum TaxID=1093897 RepID=A0AAJ0BT59_9PEZI|nr:uncharacterized protein QBC33DRAFT_573845 [Phialemonium atrogriseum]KAK1762933.1 hypothetical protein QBC33DRAFT_573845 [Phialemonium atrogriseum]